MCSSDSFRLSQSSPQMSSAPNLSFQPGQGTTTDSSGLTEKNPGQVVQAPGAGTSDVQIGEQTQRTKLGSLVNFLGPVLQGGLVGWAGGKGTPGGGFTAANNFFTQQRQLTMQQAMMRRQLYNDQVQNAQRIAEEQYYARGGPVRQNAPVIGDNGNFWSMNPVTRQLEDTGVKAQPKAAKADATDYDKDRGVIVDRTKNTWTVPVREGSGDEGANQVSTGLPTGPPTAQTIIRKNAGLPTTLGNGSPAQSPSGIATSASGGLPTSPNALPPKPVNPGSETNQLKTKAEASIRAQHPNWNDAEVYSALEGLGRKPESDGTPTPAQMAKQRAQLFSLQNRELAEAESAHARALDRPEAEFNMDELNTNYQNQVNDIKQRYRDFASATGIDLDTPPSGNRKAGGGSSPARPKGVPSEAVWNPSTSTWQLKKGGKSQPSNGDLKYYQGVPYVFDGNQYVRSRAGAGQ
jgi:hypothetical protein